MPIAPSRACEWCIGSTWCHLSGFYGLEELTNLRYIHIIYNLNCPESQLLASPYLRKKGLCGSEDAEPFSGLCSRLVRSTESCCSKLFFLTLPLQACDYDFTLNRNCLCLIGTFTAWLLKCLISELMVFIDAEYAFYNYRTMMGFFEIIGTMF